MSSMQASPVFATSAAQVEHMASTVPRLLRAIARAVRALAAEYRRPPRVPLSHETVALRREAQRQASLLRADAARDLMVSGWRL